VYNCQEEMTICKEALGQDGLTARKLRESLREEAFGRWSGQLWQGVGVRHYREYPRANQFTTNKNSLSCSEWTAAIKLNVNYANLAGVPGVEGHKSNRCRRCGNETETPSHVLGMCPFGEVMRLARHNKVKNRLSELLRQKGFTCIEEAFCIDTDGRRRFVDILAFAPDSDEAYIIDPTIRFETNNDLGLAVQEEKQNIYEPCIPDLVDKYRNFGHREFQVLGLWWGARGTVPAQVVTFFQRFKLDKKMIPLMAETVLTDSIRMLHRHIYG
jgi:hypothetical protein